ncbi:hypothetical protein P9112_003934 [Eukaryota sp. TZLM1-RC]
MDSIDAHTIESLSQEYNQLIERERQLIESHATFSLGTHSVLAKIKHLSQAVERR